MKFVDIKNDIAFRKIFGNEKKKEILISFLNAILDLRPDRLIVDIAIQNPYLMPEIAGLKSSILDVKVTDLRGVTYIVEMQVEEPDGFDKRVQYYTAKQYAQQIVKGDDYPKLNQVIFIGILNFSFFEGKSYLTRHMIVNTQTGKQELKDLEFTFVELPKFKIKPADLKTLTEKWVYFIKNAENLNVMPDNTEDAGLKHAYEDAAQHNWTKSELEAYDYAAMRKQDEIGKRELAERRAAMAGEAAGMIKGEIKGEIKGKIEVITKGIKAGYPNDILKNLTDFTDEQIDEIREQLKNTHDV